MESIPNDRDGHIVYLDMKKFLLIVSVLLSFAASSSWPGIDNSALIPPYKPDDKVNMEGTSPDWVKSLVMVELRIETSTFDGNFKSAVNVLDHYAEMGVNGLWICPVYERTGANGYLGFGPHLLDDKITGTNNVEAGFKAAKKFVDEAHSRNIRVFFDIVIWGIATNSPLVTEHPEWIRDYNVNWGGYNFKSDNTAWREWFIQQATNLVFKTGIDGFRCDVEPFITGYDLWKEVRRRCYANGRKICIISELHSTKNGVYDFEQNGVGYVHKDDWVKIRESGNYFISNNIVDSVKTGGGVGIPEAQQGRGRFYTYNICNHDSWNPIVLGNIVRFGYQAIFAPYIPLWYIGEEWINPRRTSSVLYFNRIDWTDKNKEPNTVFFEKIKKLIRIRRQYPDIFDYFPGNHREANICKVNVPGNNLQSYARYKNGRAILVIPNFSNTNKTFTIIPPYNDMEMKGVTRVKITDLINDIILLTNVNKSTAIEINIPAQDLAVFLVERADD